MLKNKKSYTNCPDEILMQHICNNDTKAFNELYQRYSQRLLYYFYRMLGNSKTTAQDFLQDIFYKIIDKPQLFDTKRKFSTWIFSIAHNMCKNEYRKRTVRKNMMSSNDLDQYYIKHDDDSNENNKIIEYIFNELEMFDDEYKTAFILRYREGFQVKEISKVLNLTEGTTKSRLFYTRQKISERLKKKLELIEY